MRILLVIITILISGITTLCHAQKDPDAVQAAMAILLHRHSSNADTVANEISAHFKKSAPMQTALARAYYRNNERAKTRYFINKALTADEKYAPAYVLHGDMYGEWDVDSACYWFSKAIAMQPKDPEAYVRYANVMARKDMDKAKAMLDSLKARVPSYNTAVELAAIYNKKGDDKAAAEAFEAADLNTLSMNMMAQYLQNCYWANNDAKGMEVAKVAISRFPQNHGFNRVYAWCAARSHQTDLAIEQAEIWFANAPADSINSIDYLAIGTAYMAKGRYDKCFSYLAKIKTLKNDYFAPQMPSQITQAVNANVNELKEAGNYEKAAELYSAYIADYPSSKDPAYQYYTLSQIYRDWQNELNGTEKMEVITKMFEVYKVIEKKYPKWENIHYVLYTHARWTYSYFDSENEQGLAEPLYRQLYNFLLNRKELSEQEKAMMVEACQYEASYNYFQLHNVKEARQWWSRILIYDPDNENAKNALAKIKK